MKINPENPEEVRLSLILIKRLEQIEDNNLKLMSPNIENLNI